VLEKYLSAQAGNDHTPRLVLPIKRAPPPAASRSPFLRRKIAIFPLAARIWCRLNEGARTSVAFARYPTKLRLPRGVGIVYIQMISTKKKPRQILPGIPGKQVDAPPKKPNTHIVQIYVSQDGLGISPKHYTDGYFVLLLLRPFSPGNGAAT